MSGLCADDGEDSGGDTDCVSRIAPQGNSDGD
jgi:hypothetical protein